MLDCGESSHHLEAREGRRVDTSFDFSRDVGEPPMDMVDEATIIASQSHVPFV